MAEPKIRVYYDGACRGCSAAAGAIERSSKAPRFALKDAHKELPASVDMEDVMYDVHVVDEQGNTYRGAEGIARILEEYPRWRWLARLARAPVFRWFAVGTYRVVADNRYWIFGRKNVS